MFTADVRDANVVLYFKDARMLKFYFKVESNIG